MGEKPIVGNVSFLDRALTEDDVPQDSSAAPGGYVSHIATHGDDKMDSELLDTSAYLLALCSTLHQVVARATSTRSCAQRVETVVKRDLDENRLVCAGTLWRAASALGCRGLTQTLFCLSLNVLHVGFARDVCLRELGSILREP